MPAANQKIGFWDCWTEWNVTEGTDSYDDGNGVSFAITWDNSSPGDEQCFLFIGEKETSTPMSFDECLETARRHFGVDIQSCRI
jgi:hypothetical protein